jgi:uncharacterized metal-binding protein
MASGVVHQKWAKRTNIALGSLGAVLIISQPEATGALLAIGLLAGGIFGQLHSPDRDLHLLVTEDERLLMKSLPVIGALDVRYGRILGRVMSHRGISHTWPWGTLLRFLFFLWPFLFLTWRLVDAHNLEIYVAALWWSSFFGGQSMQDFVHYTLDGIVFRGGKKTKQ